ncbi:portal protein [Fimbriimonas ginsengisoli]|uniref:Portal protein n=1 Tax=Fimbriimonas ginsengisoli Gsoil 348 TaxID=661478 RepID=A0A068NW24_FIMGI|nr:hypothetical protein [Fimbriimonas ginsengisoli]AIE86980.1 hypothetical protein OP10G_3612 [Fimbriimonas ginsengisoli Gsoil 348]
MIDLLVLSDGQKKKLAERICKEIEASEQAKGSLPQRWERNEKIYGVDPDVSSLHVAEGMQPYAIPLYRQKADRVIGTIYSSITGLYPFVQALDEDADGNNDEVVERALQAMADDAQFNSRFKKILKLAVNTNIGTLRVSPDFPKHGVRMEWIHPGNMMCYPAENGCYEEAKTIGHRFYKMRYRIEAEQNSGHYYKGEIFGGDDPNEHYSGRSRTQSKTETTSPVVNADDQVELWEVVHESDVEEAGVYKRYLCVVAKNQTKLLSCQPFPYSEPWYFAGRLEEPDGNVWPADSLAQTMQGLQLAYNDIHTTLIHGSYMAAFPMVVISGGTLPTKVKKYGPATLIESSTELKVQALTTGFNPGALPMEGAKLEQVADGLTGISRLGTSENMPSGTTATAAAGFLQAQNEAKDQYTEAMSPFVQRVWGFLYEVLTLHFEEVAAALGSKWPRELTWEMIRGKSYRFEVTGKSGSSSPQTLLNKLQMLLQLSADPQSGLDRREITEKIVQALDLPFSAQGLKSKPPAIDPQEILQLLQAVAGGQVPVPQAAQVLLTDIQNATQTNGGSGSGAMALSPMAGGGVAGPGGAPGPVPGPIGGNAPQPRQGF